MEYIKMKTTKYNKFHAVSNKIVENLYVFIYYYFLQI